MDFLNIKLQNGTIFQVDIHSLTLREWLKLQDIVIEQYGFIQFLKYTNEVLKSEDEIAEENCKWIMEHC